MKKIPTIFLRNLDGPEKYLVNSQVNPKCEWVFNGEGWATQKIDGTSCLIRNGNLFKRRESKAGQFISAKFIEEDFDPITRKKFGWVPVAKEDKYHIEAFKRLLIPLDGTYELVGPAINQNPENYASYYLIKHGRPVAEPLRTFDGLRSYLVQHDYEGLVFYHQDGRMAKIKSKDFGLDRRKLFSKFFSN